MLKRFRTFRQISREDMMAQRGNEELKRPKYITEAGSLDLMLLLGSPFLNLCWKKTRMIFWCCSAPLERNPNKLSSSNKKTWMELDRTRTGRFMSYLEKKKKDAAGQNGYAFDTNNSADKNILYMASPPTWGPTCLYSAVCRNAKQLERGYCWLMTKRTPLFSPQWAEKSWSTQSCDDDDDDDVIYRTSTSTTPHTIQ